MKVGLALDLLNHDTAAAIEYCIGKEKLHQSDRTTAWFIKTMFRWFKLMSSRERKLAISHLKEEKHEETLKFLEEVIFLFGNLKIGVCGKWKPVQTAVILSTTTALDLQKVFLEEKGYRYLLLSRFSQDALENLFSMIRLKNPVPTYKGFKYALRLITVSQFFQPIRQGSYEVNDDVYLLEYVKSGPKKRAVGETGSAEGADDTENMDTETLNFELEDGEGFDIQEADIHLPHDEQQSLYYLCGRTVRQVKKRYHLCTECKRSLQIKDNLPVGYLTELKSYTTRDKNMPLVRASETVFILLKNAERIFRNNEAHLLQGTMCLHDLLEKCRTLKDGDLPQCHNVSFKLLKVYLMTRIHFLVRKFNNSLKQKVQPTKCDSRSIGMRSAVKHLK